MALLSAVILFGTTFIFVQLLLIGRWNGGHYDRPIIGVLSQPVDQASTLSTDFIPGAYVKFFESCGSRVVPLDWRLAANETRARMNEINGVAIVGSSSVSLVNEDGTFTAYTKSAFNVLDYAKMLNDMHSYFPVFGLSSGHLVIHLYETKTSSILAPSTAEKSVEIPNFLDTPSSLFNLTTESSLSTYKVSPVGWNIRSQCITEDAFAEAYSSDPSLYMVVTTSSSDAEGQTCVTITEGRDYPFYTVQYHIEQAMYDFSDAAIPHDAQIRQFAEDIGFFFAREQRNSIHYFNSYIHVTLEYIWNNNHVYNFANTIADTFFVHTIEQASE